MYICNLKKYLSKTYVKYILDSFFMENVLSLKDK